MFSYFETEFRLLIALWDGVDLAFCLDVLYWETTIAYISAANCFYIRFSVYRKFFNLFGAIQVQLVKLIYSFPTGHVHNVY